MFLRGLNPEEKSAFYALAKDVVSADNDFGENEKYLMDQFLDEMDLSEADIEVMTAGAAFEIFMEAPLTVRKQVYIELVGLSLCEDGEDENEIKVLQIIAENFGLSEDVTAKLNSVVKELLCIYQKMHDLIAEDA